MGHLRLPHLGADDSKGTKESVEKSIKGVIAFRRPPSEMRHRVVQNRTQGDKTMLTAWLAAQGAYPLIKANDDPTARWGEKVVVEEGKRGADKVRRADRRRDGGDGQRSGRRGDL